MEENIKLQNLLDIFELREGYDLNELIDDIVCELDMLKHPSMGEHTLSMDECGIEWDDDCVCVLDDFIKAYTNRFLECVCNVIKTEMEEETKKTNGKVSIGDYVMILGAKEEDIDGILEKYKGVVTEVMGYDEEEKSIVVELNDGNITIDLYKGEYKKVDSQ